MKFVISICSLFFFLNLTFGQLMELASTKNTGVLTTERPAIINLYNHGFAAYGMVKYPKEELKCKLVLFDRKMNESKTYIELSDIKVKHSLQLFDSISNNLYILDKAKSTKFSVSTLNLTTGEFTKKYGELKSSFEAEQLFELNEQIYVSGISAGKPALLKINPINGENSVIKLPMGESARRVILFAERNLNENSIDFMVRDGVTGGTITQHILRFGESGNFSPMCTINCLTDKVISKLSITWLNHNELLVAGAYSSKPNAEAEGLFVSKWSGGKEVFTNTYDFTSFEDKSFLSMMERDLYINGKQSNSGKESKHSSFELFVHPLQITNDQFTLIAEVKYPKYEIIGGGFYHGTNTPVPNSAIPIGYATTNLLVVGDSIAGGKKYNCSFPFWITALSRDVSPKLNIKNATDRLLLMWHREGYVMRMEFQNYKFDHYPSGLFMKSSNWTSAQTEFWVDEDFYKCYINASSKLIYPYMVSEYSLSLQRSWVEHSLSNENLFPDK